MGPAPWIAESIPRGRRREQAPIAQLRRLSAALGLGLLAIDDDTTSRATFLSEYVRCSLIRWQMSLRNDGRPRDGRGRNSPWHAPIAACLTQLLHELPEHQSPAVQQDLARYLHWLSTRHQSSAWIEACCAGALIEGAAIVEDDSLLRRGRPRLNRLLAHQDPEGWFPEQGGADPGRLGLMLDVLARVRDHAECPQIHEAIPRALGFLTRLVRPDGGLGASVGTCGTGFLSPDGIERLAPDHPDAASLARVCRGRFSRLEASRLESWSDALCALLGARLASAARMAIASLPEGTEDLTAWRGEVCFPNAGIGVFATGAYHAVVSGRRGGAVHVHWRSGEQELEDEGPTVVVGHRTRTAGRFDPRTQVAISTASMTCRGALRPTVRVRRRFLNRLRRLLGRRRVEKTPRSHSSARALPDLAHKWQERASRFQRQIKFGDDWIAVHDELVCRRRFAAVVCHRGDSAARGAWADRSLAEETARPPVFLDAFKRLVLTHVYRCGALLEFCVAPACDDPDDRRSR